MWRKRLLVLAIAGSVLAGLLVWFRPRPRPNLLLITLDTTRADRLACYGYAAGRTPALDSLAATGVLCEHAFTVAPLTLPAHTSLFTGLYPPEHGIRTNGRGRLDDSIPTIAESLAQHGYDTSAFVASFVLNRKFGLDRGFRQYDDDFTSDEPAPDSLHRERRGAAVVDAVLKWLDQPRSRPFFCWVHLYDPHAPYLAHSDLFGDEYVDRPYDGEIAYVDRQIGRMLDFLKGGGHERQTLVVVVGDHGEGLGDHLERKHGSTLYNETMRVPLIFRFPGRLEPGRRVQPNLSLVDVPSTILDLLELGDRRKIAGQSIKTALLGGRAASSPCYGATDEPYLNCGCAPLRSLAEGRWKYIRTTRAELYDLVDDPRERNNLADARPDAIREMEAQLAEFESRLVARTAVQVQLSPAELRALSSLGYVGGVPSNETRPASGNLPDVKDMLPFDIAIDEARDLAANGEVAAAIERLREIVRQVPGNTSAHWYLAGALQQNSEHASAEEVLRRLLALKPESREGHYALGLLLMDQNRSADAIPEFLKILEIDPDFAEAHVHLGKAYAMAGEGEKALEHFDAALECDRQNGDAYHWRANLLVGRGQVAKAIVDYRKALKYAPDAPDAHHNLGRVLAESGDVVEAQVHFERAVEISPANAELRQALGAFLLRRGQFAAAVTHLTEAVRLKPGFAAAERPLREAQRALEDRKRQPQ